MSEVDQCPAPDSRSSFRRRLLALAGVQLIGVVIVIVAVAVLAQSVISERAAFSSSADSRSNLASPRQLDGRFVPSDADRHGAPSLGGKRDEGSGARQTPAAQRRPGGKGGSPAANARGKTSGVGGTNLERLLAPGRFAYHGVVRRVAKRYSVESRLVMAIIASESGGNPAAVSPDGAVGLMQLMPDTAAHLGVDPWDPEQNVEGAVRYLASLLSAFRSVDLSLVAYNAGPGFAEKYKNGEVELGAETRSFLIRVSHLLQ